MLVNWRVRSKSEMPRRQIDDITPRQREALQILCDFQARCGYPPTVQELADALGITKASAHEQILQLIRKGYVQRDENRARGLCVVRHPKEMAVSVLPIPIIGRVAAGAPILAEENVLGEVLVDASVVRRGTCFALEVKGDSMIDADIVDGDLVIVRRQPLAEDGDIVVALLGDEATVKRLRIREDQIELRPENRRLKPIPVGPDDSLTIVGKVIATRRISHRK
jgi:repressor LexA